MSDIQILINKIDDFIRKYYKNQLIRGTIYFSGLAIAFFLIVTFSESVGQFDTSVRTFLFYFFIISLCSILTYYILIPLSKLYKLSKTLSVEEASIIIGKHFKKVDDKLFNTLQLHKQLSSINAEQRNLLEASIQQRTNELRPVPFISAIDLSLNKSYLKFALIPLAILILLLILKPKSITESTSRIVHHNTFYEKEAPFKFIIKNKELQTVQNHDFEIEFSVIGDVLPEQVFLVSGSKEYKCSKNSKNEFSYLFKNIQTDISFSLSADEYTSKPYLLKSLPNPLVLNFEVTLNYPNYTGKKNEKIFNSGDLTVPDGTVAIWKFNTKNTDQLNFQIASNQIPLSRISESEFQYKTTLVKNFNYTVKSSNKYYSNSDTIPYATTVIPDQFPQIFMEEKVDSFSSKIRYFKGDIKDDYGFTKMIFTYRKINKSDSTSRPHVVLLPVAKNQQSDKFFYVWDMNSIQLNPGDELEYFAEVWDNDGIHGAKSAKSQKLIFKAPTEEELASKQEKANDNTEKEMKQALKKAKDINKELADLNKKLLDKKVLTYEEIKRLNELTKKQTELAKQIEEIKNENKKNNNEINEFNKPDEALMEKQKKLQEMFESIVPEELKEKMKELEKLLQQMDKDKVQESLEKMKLDNKDLEKELDRTMEIFKQMEFEQKMNNTLDKLDKLADKQDKLSDKSNEKNSKSEDIKQEQKQLEEKFEEIKKDIDALEKDAQELSSDEKKMFDEEEKKSEENIEKDMKQSEQQLDQNQKSKASKSQKSAANKMKEMKDKMQSAMNAAEQEQAEEDVKSLRDILDNLVHISFEQEELIKKISKTEAFDPQYVKHTQQQKKLKDDAKMIEDSLLALSKRQPDVSAMINREISKINSSMEKTIAALAERQTGEAAGKMQFIMTSENNLALMLSESLDQMMQQQQQSKPGSGKCSKPGGTGSKAGKPKPSASQMKKMQEKINKEIEKLKQQLDAEKQANKGGKKPGEKPGQKPGEKPGGEQSGGSFGTSKQLAQMAAQQEALRRELQKMSDALNKDGKQGNGALQKIAQEMEKTENDIVNRNITQETLKRQSEILTRLLEAEKADQERDEEERRKSNEAKSQPTSNPNNFLEYRLLKQREAELLKTVSPALTPYYKNKVNEYFNTIR
jgi:hypothetical protein